MSQRENLLHGRGIFSRFPAGSVLTVISAFAGLVIPTNANTLIRMKPFIRRPRNKECDLFRCVENGKLYIPCENDLQEYIENKRRKNECLDCDCYDGDFGCTMPSIDRSYACPKSSGDNNACEDYKSFYEDITALYDCNDCGIKGVCKFLPKPGQKVRINCPLWVERKKEC